MVEPAAYSTVEVLRDGRRLEIRALRRADRVEFLAAIGRIGADSLQRRFFGARRSFSSAEVTQFVEVDFQRHVALVAVVDEGGRSAIVGSGRYVVVRPGTAEVAFAVVDAYQGRGVGTALMRHLARIARGAGLQELVAEVLGDNSAMLRLLAKSGLPVRVERSGGIVHASLRLA